MAEIKVGGNYQNITPPLVQTKNTGNINSFKNKTGITTIGADFGTLLREQLDKNSGIDKNNSLQFSKHAQQRVTQRGIEVTPELMSELSEAVRKADAKGAKDIVIFDTVNAFIVNVPNKTVITTMSGSEMRDSVFTNIDGAVII